MRYAVLGVAVLYCVAGDLGRALSAETDQPARALPDVLSKASKEAFELLTAPRAAPADMTIKIVGEQRHWTYTYTNPPGPAFKGAANATTAGQPDMDSDIVVPQGKSVELLLTANDTAYELALRELDVSLTAIPGRLESHTLLTTTIGRLVAVCSSNCDAAGHADPIAIRVVSPEDYELWLRSKMDKKQ
jgi:cytochrome c oxidase subunit II